MGMLQLAPNSSSLLFPLREQVKLFNHRMIEADHSKKFLLSGIKQVAIFSSTGCNIQSDPIVNWFDKDKVSKVIMLKFFSTLYTLTDINHVF